MRSLAEATRARRWQRRLELLPIEQQGRRTGGMAKVKKPGGGRVGAVKGRSQVRNPSTGLFVKRDTASGRFIGVKKSSGPYKGVRKER